MRTLVIVALLATATAAGAAAEKKAASADVQKAVISFAGACDAPATYTEEPYTNPLPKGFSATLVTIKSDSPYCGGQKMLLTLPNGDYWAGVPWVLSDYQGTGEERLARFTLERLKQPMKVTIKRDKLVNGLYRAAIADVTPEGSMTIEGWIDPASTNFFMGNFMSKSRPAGEQRLARLASVLQTSPSRGGEKAAISLVEFSDFQCPSCKHAATFLPSILAKYGEKVRYTRVDLPLTNAHPWAFAAAVMGRAIHRQNPEAFWPYKDAIYENQDNLNLFVLEDFARGFAADHRIDIKKFDADVQSAALKQEIFDSVGAAFSLPVMGTPTYLVNGELVIAGEDGANLDRAIAKLLD